MKRKKRPSRYQQERQRFRNTQRKILSLEERVQAIRLYDQSPIYMRVATALNCSWEQIKNVIQNREAILEYHARCQTVGGNDNPRLVRQKKINFLGKVMYEYIRRALFYGTDVIDNESVRERALLFRNILQIDCFSPNKSWVSDFKTAYNLDFTQLDALVFTQKPPSSLNCVDIVVYCSKELENTQNILQTIDVSGVGAEESETYVNNVIDVDSTDSQDFELDNIDQQDEFDDDAFMDFGAEDEDIDTDEDSVADGDDINENEEGPTIYYGDDDYNDVAEDSLNSYIDGTESAKELLFVENEELQSLHKEPLLTKSSQKSPNETRQESATHPQKTLEEPQTSAQKVQTTFQNSQTEQQKLSKEIEPNECIPKIESVASEAVAPTNTTTAIIDNALISSLRESLRKDNYAAALEILQPLEEFALLEENFSAINLLSQLMVTFRKGRKSKMQAGHT